VDTPRLETEVFEMPRFRVPCPPEFRRRMLALVRSGRTPEDHAREFEPTAQSIAHGARQADRDGGATSAEREELS
jgi:transposase-like protein